MDANGRAAANVRRELLDRGISQTTAGVALGMSQAAVSRRLCGDVAFDVTELVTIARLMGMDTASLLAA